jgi:hypothetical protein
MLGLKRHFAFAAKTDRITHGGIRPRRVARCAGDSARLAPADRSPGMDPRRGSLILTPASGSAPNTAFLFSRISRCPFTETEKQCSRRKARRIVARILNISRQKRLRGRSSLLMGILRGVVRRLLKDRQATPKQTLRWVHKCSVKNSVWRIQCEHEQVSWGRRWPLSCC